MCVGIKEGVPEPTSFTVNPAAFRSTLYLANESEQMCARRIDNHLQGDEPRDQRLHNYFIQSRWPEGRPGSR